MSRKILFREPVGPQISILMTGDFCPREVNNDYVPQNAGAIVSEIKPVFDEADLRILQWETAITEQDTPALKQGGNIRCSAGCLQFSKELGIDIHLLANNHVGDFGPDAALETIRHCQDAGIKTVGAGKNKDEARKPLIVNCKGLRIGIVNVAENEFGMADEDTPGVSPFDFAETIELIRDTKPTVDILIAAIHGGHEFNPLPSPRVTKYSRIFADSGADIVFNCHTHFISPTELYKQVPIVYSPGNFYFPEDLNYTCTAWNFGYLIRFYCDQQGCFGYETIPHTFDKSKVRLLNQAEEAEFNNYFEHLSRIIADKELLQRYFEAWCVGDAGHIYLEVINKIQEENFPPDWTTEESRKKWIHVKNDFCCESHNDMMRQFLLLIVNGKVTKARELLPELKKLCSPQWIIDISKK